MANLCAEKFLQISALGPTLRSLRQLFVVELKSNPQFVEFVDASGVGSMLRAKDMSAVAGHRRSVMAQITYNGLQFIPILTPRRPL